MTDVERVLTAGDDESTDNPDTDRVWLIQCKREKAIGPKKLGKYFDDMSDEVKSSLYGLVFVASCNLSKKSRDLLRQKCRGAGIAECHVWTVSEIEDMLFQPRNDHLLFAYFGISLKLRQRSARTKIRAKMAAKRKAYSALGEDNQGCSHEACLLRDPRDDRYPWIDEDKDRREYDWRIAIFRGHEARGMRFQVAKYFAFLDDDDKSWDMADEFNDLGLHGEDPWSKHGWEFRNSVHQYWYDEIDEAKRAIFEIEAIIPYDEILEIDKHGDNVFRGPHIFILFEDHDYRFESMFGKITVPPITREIDGRLETVQEVRKAFPKSRTDNRVAVFPDKYRRKFDEH